MDWVILLLEAPPPLLLLAAVEESTENLTVEAEAVDLTAALPSFVREVWEGMRERVWDRCGDGGWYIPWLLVGTLNI